MKTVRISEDVWNEIAKRGKFGETPDDVLKRVFNIEKTGTDSIITRRKQSTKRISPQIFNGEFIVSIEGGASKKWRLPAKDDKQAIIKLTDEALKFAEQNDATVGQINYVRKRLTDSGYTITK